MTAPWPDRVVAALTLKPSRLYHATTPKKMKRYEASNGVLPPVRGFDTIDAACKWARKTHRTIILELKVMPELVQALPDHHEPTGLAWWTPEKVSNWRDVTTAEGTEL